ncbi:poly-gamma-glutamate synthesis protein (capsule biosynthesis protein) [Micromonospora rhizosphaerae]|uniref:Poly-gamma-glutamate synthesis protein (Capsule biosynthesis protein) n=1 Tax=Micromonospora rhizosphaerae TaxID=568872 RepID=A0A1C6RJR9_9ACTN|nr:CapA family protein [Micromonospora rhizosphaerae]SCL17408.1 poly-gamma-glutamate synthesis protein (capsule biosynthesis protein) [Micromonospora rhizosphaerae]
MSVSAAWRRPRVLLGAAATLVLLALAALGAKALGPAPPPETGPSPVQQQTLAPGSPPAPGRDPAGRRVLRLVAAGDVLVHPEVTAQARRDAVRSGRPGGLDFAPMFAGVAPAVSRADLALCHLETPLADPAGPFAGYPSFNAPPQVLAGVRSAGFDGCSTASNHTLDQGADGVVRTIRALDAAGLGHTGSARSAAEAGTPRIYQVAGVRVAHLAYSLNFNGLSRPPGQAWLANLIDPPEILAAAHRARAAGADIVVLSMHWGTEYRHLPDADQQAWARQLISSPDVDLILGHHAHAVQPFQRFGDKWVVFGMGNELARHAEPINDNREGVMARATFTEVAPGHWTVTRMEALPTWTDLSPDLRLVDLAAALADPATAAGARRDYRAAYERVLGYVRALGADQVVTPGG